VDSVPEVELSLSIQQEDTAAVVTIGGELEYGTAARLRSALLEISRGGDTDRLVLDMAEVDFLDSTGISLLIQAKQRFDAQGSVFVLRHPPARVTRVLEVAGVADQFTIER
jgi:anti-sigma B factor antagonist